MIFFAQLSGIVQSYARLFGVEEQGSDEDVEEGNSPQFVKHWGWYYTLDNLSNNDRSKWDYLLDLNVIAFLNTLAYYKDKQDYIAEQQRLPRNGR